MKRVVEAYGALGFAGGAQAWLYGDRWALSSDDDAQSLATLARYLRSNPITTIDPGGLLGPDYADVWVLHSDGSNTTCRTVAEAMAALGGAK